jgi:hypothetical protein
MGFQRRLILPADAKVQPGREQHEGRRRRMAGIKQTLCKQ